uniref:Uncharacterized protein n=1 Tax=Oryza rufipogon TaxID=4529 RepID=A0A0E0P8A0_ORYRU
MEIVRSHRPAGRGETGNSIAQCGLGIPAAGWYPTKVMGVPKNRFPKVKTPDIDNTQVWSVNVPLGKVITRYPRGTDATGVPKFPAAKVVQLSWKISHD